MTVRILLHHGYELTGSGSNEYTRYLARVLAGRGHQVIVACGEPRPEAFDFVGTVVRYDGSGDPVGEETIAGQGPVVVHVLPRTSVTPVYLTDKQRPGNVKAFVDLSDDELHGYHAAMVRCLGHVLDRERPDVVHANHLIWQPVVQAEVATARGIPYYVVPHGSSIEYTIDRDPRYLEHARRGLQQASGVVWISDEVRSRVLARFPELTDKLQACEASVPIGTDTSLFVPLEPSERPEALRALEAMHRPGGKTAQQRQALARELEAGRIEAVRGQWEAYDHDVEDADLVDSLRAIAIDDEIVVFLGALTWGKGVHGLLAAMPELLQRRPKARLVVIGSGTYREALEGIVHALHTGNRELFGALVAAGRALDRDGEPGVLDDLRAYADAHPESLWSATGHLADRVLFTGRLDHPRLARLLPWARLACFPSVIKEASPLVFAESLAAGVLPCAANHSGFADGLRVLSADLPGSLSEAMTLPTDSTVRVAGIAQSLGTLLERTTDPQLPARLSALARSRYDWNGIADRLLNFVQRLVKQG